jgi:hypothetical protein
MKKKMINDAGANGDRHTRLCTRMTLCPAPNQHQQKTDKRNK